MNAVTANTNQATNQTTVNNNSSSTSSTTNLDPSDPNYLNSVLEANGIDTSSTASNQTNGSNGIATNEVDPTTMASDLDSLNNALATQAEGEGISINLSSPTNFTITPDNLSTGAGNATNIAATSITANVKTAMPGYSLTIQQAANTTTTNSTSIANPNGSLINPANPSNSPILSTDGTPDSPKALGNNEWGYAISGSNNFDTTYTTGNTNSLTSKWAKVPTSTETAQTIKATEDTPPTDGDNTTVYYGVNVPKNKTAGQYQTTITYTATANVLDPPEVEKVSPDSIRQGMQVATGTLPNAGIDAATGMSGGTSDLTYQYYNPGGAYTCYLTDKGSVYCYGVNGNNFVRSGVQATDAIGPSSSVGSGWLEVDTTAFDGTVVQVATGTLPNAGIDAATGMSGGTSDLTYQYYNPGGAYTCYLTDKGSVYCYGVNGNNFVRSGVQATDAIGPSSSVGSGWLEVDTTAFDSSSSSAGRTITITGSKLSKVAGVYVDSNKNGRLDVGTDAQCANLSIKSDAQLTCTVPQLSPGTYNLFVVNASNQTMVPNALTYR